MSTHFLLLRSKKGEIIDICGHICETPENVKERLKNLNFRCLYKIHMCLCVWGGCNNKNHRKLGYQLESWEDMVGGHGRKGSWEKLEGLKG